MMRNWLRARARPLLVLRAVYRILNHEYGYWRSVRTGVPSDGHGEPLPWFTYSAIEFIEQFDLSGAIVFEYGSGQSTLFWQKRAQGVVSVEHNPEWHSRMQEMLGSKVRYHFIPEPKAYARAIADHDEKFDIIVIDGIARLDCCEAAMGKLSKRGMIIFDNSDRHPRCTTYLRDAGFIQADMTGFGPVNDYAWTTSFFFARGFDLPARNRVRPGHGRGCLGQERD